jgi:hypothetical protein
MANTFATADWVCMETLRQLLNKLEVAAHFNTSYNKEYTQAFPVGETVRIKFPQRYLVRDGITYTSQPITRRTTDVTMNQFFGIDFDYDSVDQALKMERGEEAIKKEYIAPAVDQLKQEIDSRAALWATQNTPMTVGVLAANTTSFDTIGAAQQMLIEQGCPQDSDWGMILTPRAIRGLIGASANVFNPSQEISKQFRKGMIGENSGFDFYRSMSLYSHTAGTWAGAVTVTGANQSGSSLIVTGTVGDTIKKGDMFTILNVNAANPSTRRDIGALKQYQAAADLTLTAGPDTIALTAPIYGPGSQYQNVVALPADGAALTLFTGTTSPNGKSGMAGLALHKDAFALVGVKLDMPKAIEAGAQYRDPKTGLSIRFTKTWDAEESRFINRLDTLIGFGNLYNDACAVRVLSL